MQEKESSKKLKMKLTKDNFVIIIIEGYAF